ncbi:retention module-containing protein [Vibrio coralliilyticus]|uniref:retention module-containing protein n=1 Tax=Vibrio coralliilyticus TaxID=190893 RepID=UPI00117E8D51|nr:retention module-containing protein [Vibrio coralliilyticus]
MEVEIVRQARIVEEVNGDVIAVKPDGAARKVIQGETIQSNEIMITARNASVVLSADGVPSEIDENSISLDLESAETGAWHVAPVDGDVEFDLDQLGEGALSEDDIAAIQGAILDGADPTQILEATAAGAGGAGSANGGFVTIDYNGTEVLASTFFETSAQAQDDAEETEDELRTLVFAAGGESISEALVEGSLSSGTYPQSETATVTIFAGDLPLDADSFVPEPASLASLLAELNSDITSSGEAVTFTYDSAENAIIGVNAQGEVLRIDIDTTLIGKDVSLELTTTVSQPIDHVDSVGGGQVAISDDQISVSFDITGADSGGNAIRAPIDAQVSIGDGVNPTPQATNVQNVESDSTLIQGEFVEIGSDALASVTFDSFALQQFDGLLSDNQSTTATLSDDGTTITLTADGSGDTVLTVSVDTQGQYEYQQFKPLEHNGSDTISLSLPTTIVDYDQDTVTNDLNIEITDGDNPVITNVDGLSLDESGVAGGSQVGTAVVSGSGSITATAGSDIIDHFELEPSEFNTDGSLTSQGQQVTLELTANENGVRTYEGVIELNGSRVTVFEIKVDSPAQGDYEFTLFEQLDHLGANDESLTIELPVYAVDADGDRSELAGGTGSEEAGKILIQVKDDAPTISGADALTLDEDDLASGSSPDAASLTANGQFTVIEGADTVVEYRLDTNSNPVAGLKSDGLAVSLSETYDSATNTYTYTASTSAQDVFVLTIKGDGTYSFELKGPIDHAANADDQTLNFAVIAKDNDGDTAAQNISVNIVDDAPSITYAEALILNENDLASGTSPDATRVSKDGDFTTLEGADKVVSYKLDLTTNPIDGLTSQGKAVTLSESIDANGVATYTASSTDGDVFVLTLRPDGSYTFELKGPIDHDANSDSERLDFTVVATDTDGDTDRITLPVTIGDDSPNIASAEALILNENDLASGTSPDATRVSKDGDFTTLEGADKVVSYKLDLTTNPIDGLTSQGKAVTLSESIDADGVATYTASSVDGDVFVLTLRPDGSYTFELKGPIDHDANSDSERFDFTVVATDTDGDTDRITLPVTIGDDSPNIASAEALILNENDLASGTSPDATRVSKDGDFTTLEGADKVVSYKLDLTTNPIDGLTSQGKAVTLSESIDANGVATYTASSTDGDVFVLTLRPDGSYTFELKGPIDHDANSDSERLDFTVVATDTDGDTDRITLPVTIGDDSPNIASAEALILNENDLASGTSPDATRVSQDGDFTTLEGADKVVSYELDLTTNPIDGLTSQGKAVTLSESIDADGVATYTASSTDGDVFVLTLRPDGSYTFELKGPIDHDANSDSERLDFTVVATDTDGDTDRITLPVTIGDDSPNIASAEALILNENDLASGTSPDATRVSQDGDFTTLEGADKVVSYKLDLTTNPIDGLTSQGKAVTLSESIDANGVATYTASSVDGDVFVLTLRPDGSYTFELKGPIDHDANSDSERLDFTVVATDTDGDTDRITLPVTIGDDSPNIASAEALILNENDLASGTSPDATRVSQDGDFTTLEGADKVVSYKLDLTTNPIDGLTSQGKAVTLSESIDADGVATYTASSTDGDVFVLTLRPDGSYTFELKGPIDHDANSDSERLDFTVVATDTDGDTDRITLPVTISDDSPTIRSIDPSSTFVVDEDDTAAGSDSSGAVAVATGSFVTSQGADGVVAYELVNIADTQNGLTSNGQAVTISEANGVAGATTYQGVAGGQVVFTLVLSDNGDYTYTQFKALDHAQNSDTLTIPFDVVAIDKDNDTSPAVRLPIEVIDDQPVLTGTTGETSVDEDDLAGIGSDRSEDTTINGNFVIAEGADIVVEYELTNADDTLDGLSADGEALEWAAVQTSGTTFTYTAMTENGHEPVFRIVFDTSDNSYQFELLKPLDHPDGAGENSVQIDFTIKATDFDGDESAEITLPVTVVDDVPLLTDHSISRVEGSGFKRVNMFEASTDKGADDAAITMIEGTTDGTSVIKFGGENGTYVDSVDIQSGNQTIKVYEEYDTGNGTRDIRELGELRVNSNGDIRFKAYDNLEHDGDTFDFSIDVTATDGDKDTSTAQLDLTIVDRKASAIALKVTTFEESGRDPSIDYDPNNPNTVDTANVQDNQSGITGLDSPTQILLQANLYDADNNESIGGMTIKAGDHHGTFYYFDGSQYVELEPNNRGKIYIDGSLIDQTSSVNGDGDQITTITNLYFVPDRNYSTDESGIQIKYQLEIDNDGTLDHKLNSSFRIEVESVADIATWDDANSTYEYTLTEDGAHQTLNLSAVTQDTSNPETITYRLEVTQGQGEFELLDASGNVIAESSPGVYLISSDDINSVQLNPRDNFSGAIKFDAKALTEESSNAVSGKETAESVVQELVFNVTPVADDSSFSVNRISIFEDNAASQNTVDPDTDHEPFTLDKVITLNSTADIDTPGDTSEVLYVRLSDFTDENGQPLTGFEVRWVGSGDPLPLITDASGSYYEIAQSDLDKVEIQPPLHSNENFTFEATGVVKDTATLGDGSQVTDVVEMGAGKTVHVSVKGVADIPYIPDVPDVPDTGAELDTWYSYTDGNGNAGAQVVINENSSIELSFAVLSGEEKDGVNDNSESITVLLSDIPDGVQLYDSNGGAIDLVYVGSDANGPIYQANITQEQYNSGITVEPPKHSTEDINITTKVIVTENDGHIREVDGSILVKVVPVIDAGGSDDAYSRTSTGNEDSFIVVPWNLQNAENPDRAPDTNDRDYEFVSSITISGFPEDVEITIDGVPVANYTGGTAIYDDVTNTLTITGLDENSSQPVVRVKPPEDSSVDMNLQTKLVIEEHDADNNGDSVAPKEVTGSLTVVVRPIVESDGDLQVKSNNAVVTTIDDADDDGRIDFTINDQNGDANVIVFEDLDPSSDELVKEVVVRFVGISGDDLDQLFVTGAVNNGDGSWTVTDEENFSIVAPDGLSYTDSNGLPSSTLTVEFVAQVYDKGDENENGPVSQKSTTVDLTFPTDVIDQNSEAAVIEQVTTPDAIITGVEDNYVDLSSQISNVVQIGVDGSNVSTADHVADQFTIVIDPNDIPAEVSGLKVIGAEYDFANNLYLFEATINPDGSISIPDGLKLELPEDYAGDFNLPITFVTTDKASGDENRVELNIPVAVTPVVDIAPGAGEQGQPLDSDVTPEISLSATSVEKGTGTQLDANAREDNLIKLDLDIDLADVRNDSHQGQETLTRVEITLPDSSLGYFADVNGDPIQPDSSVFVVDSNDPVVIQAALDGLYFVPKENYPTDSSGNSISFTVKGTVVDQTVFDTTGTTQVSNTSSERTFTQNVDVDITPVLDPVTMPTAADNIVVVGDEDTDISLTSGGSGLSIALNDTDGSEQFLSAKLTGVPDDFTVTSTSSDFVVKNSGGGEWVIQLTDPSVTEIDMSAISIRPAEHFSGTADIGITVFTQEQLLQAPTAHQGQFSIDVTPVGDVVDVDPTSSVTGNEGENIDIAINASIVDKTDLLPGDSAQDQPETLLITVEQVPDGATIYYPDGVTPATNLGNGKWELRVDAQEVDKIVFNSGDHNKGTWNEDSLKITVQSVDKDADGNEYLGPTTNQVFDVAVDVEAVNDRPEFNNIADIQTAEDTVVAIKGFTVSDVDSSLDDPDAEYTLTLNVDSGELFQDTTIAANNGLTVSVDASGQTVTITGKVADINSALAQDLVTFKPDENSNDLIDTDGVKVTAHIDDQGNVGSVDAANPDTSNTNETSFVIHVSEVNDEPQAGDLDLGDILEEGSIQITAAQLIAASNDIDGDDLVVKSISVPAEQGTLTLNPDGVSWTFTAADDFNGDVSISYTIEDNGTTNGVNDFLQDTGTVSLSVIGVNDKPEIDVDDITTIINESSGQLISGISVSDADYVDAFANDAMTVTLSVDFGQLNVTIPAGSSITATPSSGSSITLTGTIGELNALLDSPSAGTGVTFDATHAPSDSVMLTITATDSGNPSGMVMSETTQKPITITPVANAPTLSIAPDNNYVKNINASLTASNNGIALLGIVAALTDVHEALSLELSGLPAGSTVETSSGTLVPVDGKVVVPADDIDSVSIVGAQEGAHTIQLTAVSTETDSSTAESAPIDINLNVTNDISDIDVSSSSQDNQLLGSDEGIELQAGSGDDRIEGGTGNDTLIGGAGDDTLLGGAGDDILDGGLGSDILTGGTGEDTFIWHEIDDGATDTITDFSIAEGDQIDLREVLPELKQANVDMDTLLSHLDAKLVDGDDIELKVHPDGNGNGEQTILVEDLGQQIDFNSMDSSQIISTLLEQHIIVHDQ